jgi:trehalose/maltose hydrolase-like predicted phosphorylase
MAATPHRLPAEPSVDPTWLVVDEGFQLPREHEVESLFALSNGYAGTRGSLAEGSRRSTPATYLAGVFERPDDSHIPGLANIGDWARLTATIDGATIALDPERGIDHRRVLDFRQAILFREWRQRDPRGGLTTIHGMRLLSLADRHLFLQTVIFVPENYGGPVGVDVSQPGDRSAAPFTLREFEPEGSDVRVAVCSAALVNGELVDGNQWVTELARGETHRLDRAVVVYTSRDEGDPGARAMEHLREVLASGVDAAVAAHLRAWGERWRACDVAIEGDPDAQRAVRFACYHLTSVANPADDAVSIGARALTGEAYKGHVFWDTEIYVLPFYVATHPAAARALLEYRYGTLPAARKRALGAGCRGALYAWESADTGDDVTPPLVVAPGGEILRLHVGELEQHISADVAWAVWAYWEATGDDRFMIASGVEIFVETARFWASRATRGKDGRYHILDVIGPDEYHESVDDDAYTNVMAQWNLERAASIVRSLSARWPSEAERLVSALGLTQDEPDHWDHVAAAMYTGFDPMTGVFEQFRGYFELEDIDLEELEPRSAPVDVLLGRERVQRSQVIKQPDVVMLLHLLWDRFPAEVREANFRFYEPRCAHGSSLSPSIHASVAARLGDMSLAERYFREASAIDLDNNMGNASGGVHIAGLGGLWQAVVRGFAGMQSTQGHAAPTFDPHLPDSWSSLRVSLAWHGRRFVARFGRSAEDAPHDTLASEVRP